MEAVVGRGEGAVHAMTLQAETWQIARSTKACGGCARKFVDREDYFAALFPQGEGFERKDFCLACWGASGRPESFSFWKARAPEAAPKKQDQRRAVMDFFDRLMSPVEGDTPRPKLAFLFALILMQKRALRLVEQVIEGETTTMVLERASDGRTFRVADPRIAESEFDALRVEMSALFAAPLGS